VDPNERGHANHFHRRASPPQGLPMSEVFCLECASVAGDREELTIGILGPRYCCSCGRVVTTAKGEGHIFRTGTLKELREAGKLPYYTPLPKPGNSVGGGIVNPPPLTESMVRSARDSSERKGMQRTAEGFFFLFWGGPIKKTIFEFGVDIGMLINPTKEDVESYCPMTAMEADALEGYNPDTDAVQASGLWEQIKGMEERGWLERL